MDDLVQSEQVKWQKVWETEFSRRQQYREWYEVFCGQFSLRCRIVTTRQAEEPLPEGASLLLPAYECWYRKDQESEKRCIGTVSAHITLFNPETLCAQEVQWWLVRYNTFFDASGELHVEQEEQEFPFEDLYSCFFWLISVFHFEMRGGLTG